MFSRPFLVLWCAMAVAMAGISMTSPLLPVFVKDELGAPEFAVALAFSGLSITQMLTSPFAGKWGDRIGPKPFIVGGFAIYAIAGLGYVLAPNWETIVAFRIFSGIGAGGIFAMGAAYAGMLAPPGREGATMGTFAVANIVGFGFGPLIGGGLRDLFGTDAAFATMAVLFALNGLAALLFLPAHPRPQLEGDAAPAQRTASSSLSLWRMMRMRPVQAAMAIQAVTGTSWGAAGTFLAVYVIDAEGLDTGSATFAGMLFAMRSVVSGVLQPLTGRRLADRFDRVMLMTAGYLVAGIGQFFVPVLPETVVDTPLFDGGLVIAPWILVWFLLIGSAEAVAAPAQQAFYVDVGRFVGMGSIMGLQQMASTIGFLTGSLVGAAVVSAFGIEAIFRFAALVIFFGLGVFLFTMRGARIDMAAMRARQELPEAAQAAS